jgi:hypothetical protein
VRLVTLLLTGALGLSAQVPGALPWKSAGASPWQTEALSAPPVPCSAKPSTDLPLTVRLAADGALRITDDKGLILLRLGLPGRPLRVWRDWGTPIADPTVPMRFPSHSPLQRGIGGMVLGTPDFRPALEGLLWIIDDGESILTLIHPATAQVVYLPLPGGQDLDLLFYPDHLGVQEGPSAPQGPSLDRWSLHWLALLPQFIQLGKDASINRARGSALLPFPKD